MRQVLHLLLKEHGNLVAVHAQLLEDVVGYIRCFLDDTTEKMHRFDGLLTISLRYVHSGLHRFLRLDCKFVECHILISFLIIVIFYLCYGCFSLCGFSASGKLRSFGLSASETSAPSGFQHRKPRKRIVCPVGLYLCFPDVLSDFSRNLSLFSRFLCQNV